MESENVEKENYPIQLYSGDGKSVDMKFSTITDVYGTTLIVYECEEMSYQELLQFATKNAIKTNQYDLDGKPMVFLHWFDGYLFDFGKPEWRTETNEQWLGMSYVFYCHMDKYEETKTIEVFGNRTKICIIKTTRPILVKIINHVKSNEKQKVGDV